MATNASGREYNIIVAKQDVSASNASIGSITDPAATDYVTGTNLFMRNATMTGINYDNAFTTSEVLRTGRRSLEDGDLIRHYGSGTWTWDFDYLVENQVMAQTLLSLATGIEDTSTSAIITPTVANGKEDLSHGATTADNVGYIMLNAPASAGSGLASHDQCMHSAVLQSLTMSVDAGTDGGRLHMSGQFMSGYKPIVGNHGIDGATTVSDYEKSLFDAGTIEIGSHAVTCRAFSLTISNPASRVGFKSGTGEADGYIRGGLFDITGTITVKYDADTADALADWKANTAYIINLEQNNSFSFNVHNARMTGHNIDFSDEGVFVEIPFRATTGTAGDTNLATIKLT